MAKTSKFGFTNNTLSETKVSPISLNFTTNYGCRSDEPDEVVMDNKTAPIDQPELISFKVRDLPQVNTRFSVLYPPKVASGVQYVVQVEELLSTTSDTDPDYRVDDAIVAYLTIRHTKSGNITNDIIGQVVQRLIGACQNPDGTWRFDELMRSILKPSK